MEKTTKPTYEELEARLAEAEAIINAIRKEEIDAVVSVDQVLLLRAHQAEEALRQVHEALQTQTEELMSTNDKLMNANDELQASEEMLLERSHELEFAYREIQSFSYSVSHDLRAPLRSIEGFSRALLEDYSAHLNETGKDYVHRVCAASKKMGDLIEAMLSLFRLTGSELVMTRVNLSAIAGEISNDLGKTEPQRQVEWVIAANIIALADAAMIRAVLDNLLRNSWKFTAKHGKARIEFGVRRSDRETVYFVRDDGAGFDMAYADKLFTAFQRLHDAGDFPGIGIGLATVHRIIHRHGGRIWAEGEVEKGATFSFTLRKG
ncbi:MAG: sensor histidine kinase [Thermodesulfobacteriota bacterium]